MFLKEWHKVKYVFFIADAYKKFNRDNLNYNKYSKEITENIAHDVINNNFRVNSKIESHKK